MPSQITAPDPAEGWGGPRSLCERVPQEADGKEKQVKKGGRRKQGTKEWSLLLRSAGSFRECSWVGEGVDRCGCRNRAQSCGQRENVCFKQ